MAMGTWLNLPKSLTFPAGLVRTAFQGTSELRSRESSGIIMSLLGGYIFIMDIIVHQLFIVASKCSGRATAGEGSQSSVCLRTTIWKISSFHQPATGFTGKICCPRVQIKLFRFPLAVYTELKFIWWRNPTILAKTGHFKSCLGIFCTIQLKRREWRNSP